MVKKNKELSQMPIGFVPKLCTPNSLLIFYIGSILLALLIELIRSTLINFDIIKFLIYSLLISLIVFSTVVTLCLLREQINRWRNHFTALFCLGVLLGYSALFNTVAIWYSGLFDTDENAFSNLIRVLLITLIIGGILIRFLYLQQQVVYHKRTELTHKIEALQARIRPHFLFNSLNSISSLVMIDPDKAESAIDDLADLFRASLDKDHQASIEEELAVCERYLRIEKLRLADRLQVDWQIDEELLDAQMPHLLIQPLVENAVYHGIQLLPKGGTITIIIHKKNDLIEVTIVNPIPAKDTYAKHTHSNKMAMNNIKSRLNVLYGRKGELESEHNDQYYKAIIRYPCEFS